MRAALAFALLLAPVAARGSVKSCVGEPDGTHCNADCVVDGECRNGACANGFPAKDGTACATGDQCTVNDRCKNGECRPGPERICPDQPCATASCDPARGCVYANVCDLGKPLEWTDGGARRDGGPGDLGPTPVDGGAADATGDLAGVGDLGQVIDSKLDSDQAPDPGGDLGPRAASDLGPRPGPDLGGDPDAGGDLGRPAQGPDGKADHTPGEPHVHGSGCSCRVGRAAIPPWWAGLIACWALCRRWRRARA